MRTSSTLNNRDLGHPLHRNGDPCELLDDLLGLPRRSWGSSLGALPGSVWASGVRWPR